MIRPTFLAFQTAGRALAASKTNIDLTGHNISNVDTPGFSRQRVDLAAFSNSGFTQKYATKDHSAGWGVNVTGISQIRDAFLDSRFRTQNSESAEFESTLTGLKDMERVFDEASYQMLQSEILKFTNQLQTLSQAPTSSEFAMVARTSAQKVTQMINLYAVQMNEVREQQKFDLKNVIIDNSFNSTVESIAALNRQIRDELVHGNTPNELYDQRNMLIDKLSGLANIKVTATPEKVSEDLTIENLNIALHDPATGTSIGLVQNVLFNTLETVSAGEEVRIEINRSFGAETGRDITDYIAGGSLRAHLNLINGKGSYADPGGNDNAFRGTLHYQKMIDTFAATFAKTLNDLNASPDGTPKPLFASSDGGPITAASIRVSSQWIANPSFITTTSTTAGETSGNNDNILRMVAKLNSGIEFRKDPADPASQLMFRGTAREYVAGLIGELALNVELHQNFHDTADNVLSNLFAARESVSGVSLDEEGINLMSYQKSYNAAARYATVLDEAVDRLINNMGIVGR